MLQPALPPRRGRCRRRTSCHIFRRWARSRRWHMSCINTRSLQRRCAASEPRRRCCAGCRRSAALRHDGRRSTDFRRCGCRRTSVCRDDNGLSRCWLSLLQSTLFPTAVHSRRCPCPTWLTAWTPPSRPHRPRPALCTADLGHGPRPRPPVAAHIHRRPHQRSTSSTALTSPVRLSTPRPASSTARARTPPTFVATHTHSCPRPRRETSSTPTPPCRPRLS